ncbi:MAG: calcineurin-like phosphoesterase family protein [Pirellulaceae bacterium]|nr:calcineurin-like phosphoesterase family protein [Pirellulaceae bacterium]
MSERQITNNQADKHDEIGADNKSGLQRRTFLTTVGIGSAVLAGAPYGFAKSIRRDEIARGIVFDDTRGNGERKEQSRGLADVLVSNGRLVTRTDENGHWELPVEEGSTTFFVIKPRGWGTARCQNHLNRSFYIHHPDGSPKQQYAGVAPTGPLPKSIDFGLRMQEEPERFSALFCGDPQPRDAREVDFIAQTVVPQLRGTRAAFGVSLGDIMFDNLNHFERLNDAMGLVGRPWFNVVGNHDLNFDSRDNRFSTETYRRVYGPTYFSFDWGPVHFLILNNVEWTGANPDEPGSRGSYRGFFGERQLEFVANDLAHVPEDRLVVLSMHIPLHPGGDVGPSVSTVDREGLFRLIESRRHTLSFSAHLHWHGHVLMGEELGWRGALPHHHVITGTLCGSWFRGAPGIDGVPHGVMLDGVPRGYLEVDFDGNRYNIDGYRGIGMPRQQQMNIHVANEVPQNEVGNQAVYINVFNGSEKSEVRMRIAGRAWESLPQVAEPDPAYVALYERDKDLKAPYYAASKPSVCAHLWRGELPGDLETGTHLIEVVARDMFGNHHHAVRPVRVT